MTTIMITGAAGFIGGHVTREAGRRGGLALRLMSHRRPLPGAATTAPATTAPATTATASPADASPADTTPAVDGPAVRTVRADLSDPASLRGTCDGVDVLLHCASQIGGTPEANETVNARGTAALVAEARRAGVSRVVYLSTASVYGRGTFRAARAEDLVRNPGSPTSRSRADAEDAVLAAGGVVLRPHLVLGAGDTWVVPGLARILKALPGSVDGWAARTSAITAHDLARLLLGAGLAPAGDLTAAVYHAAHPVPVTVANLLEAVAEVAGVRPPDADFTAARARELLAAQGIPPQGLDMLTSDHWFDAAPLWRDLRAAPGPDFENAFKELAEGYRRTLLDI
ncbi:NAD-dependent epimerase/dehydratase family protein [Streptomyces sp. NBC_01565]|uniref:NAD-dependent epimerase/dehydratase family protein n=1 Tax=Streptomyces sp. NBC_01565 TaxID=2975881 RepID=UPI00224CBC00|nr:NAD-dependent epimerase/dehydratase family protein [Streptomyces sp. NBC_01565]MCX4545915.1 NAD-dependent epimerase/dehydratase family protein [Streptomyces sp. NBC_01565]